MRGFSQGAALTLALLVLSCAATAAEAPAGSRRMTEPPEQSCPPGRVPLITLALPEDYRDKLIRARAPGTFDVCVTLDYGSTYQVLSWLENGAVQAAVMPAFAAQVMRADDPERFDREYYDLKPGLVTTVPNRARRLLLFDHDYQPVENPDQQLGDFMRSLLEEPDRKTLWLPSHLSPTVPFVIDYAAGWAKGAELSVEARETLFAALIKAIHFGDRRVVEPDKPTRAGDSYHLVDDPYTRGAREPRAAHEFEAQIPAPYVSDKIIVRKQVFLGMRELRELVAQVARQERPAPPESIPLFAENLIAEKELGEQIANFRESNYRRAQFGPVSQRHFRFTIPEMWWLLRSADEDPNAPLALVLTGGGVKAAYQTRMIDYLYGHSRLYNAGTRPERWDISQRVNYVIGTSGGALLGIFVASMNDKVVDARKKDERVLTPILWREPGIGIDSSDVFPFLDMMRYATLIVALLVVWLVSAAALSLFRKHFRQVRRFDHSDESFFDRRARAFKESWIWIVLLVSAPIVIVKVASVSRVEHVPTITGLYYAVMALVAFYSDVRLNPLQPFKWLRARYRPRTLALFTLGAAAIAASVWLSLRDEPVVDGLALVNLCCAGFVVLILATHLFFSDQKEYFEPVIRAPIFQALGVLLAIILLAYLGVAIGKLLQQTSLFEMHGGFWKYFLLLTALFTALFMWLARSSQGGARSWWQRTAGYLFSEYRSRALFGSERRYMRFMTLTITAWVWWNALAAPALYGNDNARKYLQGAFLDYTGLAMPDVKREIDAMIDREKADRRANTHKHENEYGVPFPLKVPFVITATSLEKNQERYFLFLDDTTGADTGSGLTERAWSAVVRDPRWVIVRDPIDRELQHAAFASGSPFPVFSAHDFKLRVLRNSERLIDGGFAHNKPLEAAQVLAARKALVLNSSPLETAGRGNCTVVALNLGELACNLPKLVPYLWERSQVEDLLSTRSMVVASIYPTASRGTWPSLTDFRRDTVVDLVKDAESDTAARVGVVESWGAPNLQEERLFYYDYGEVRKALLAPQ